MSGSVRLSAGELAGLAEQLSPRDWAILTDLARVRVASGSQLQRLEFGDTSARHSRRVLAGLVDLRLICRLERRVGGVRAGSAGLVYALDVLGQRVRERAGPAGGKRRRPWTPGSIFLAHSLAVTELYVRLVEAERTGSVELLDFTTEPACWRFFPGPGGGRLVLKPDAYVRTAAGEYEHLWFIEVDRDTTSPATVARKCELYRRYWASGREQARAGAFPRVLWLVPSDERKGTLVELTGRLAAPAWELFEVVLYADGVKVMSREPP